MLGWLGKYYCNYLALLYNAKDAASFYFGRWNTGTNPDLALAGVDPNSRLPDRRILKKFPRSQHRPSLITPPRFAMAVPSMPVKRWNLCKAKGTHYIACWRLIHLMWMRLTRTSVTQLRKQPKRLSHAGIEITIFRVGMQSVNPSIKFFCSLLRERTLASSSLAATALLVKLDRKRRDQWSEAVPSIEFSHSSPKAWSILNNLTGRSRHSPRHCPVSADAIASQLVRNGKYEAVDRKSSPLVSQEVSDH